jgi:hypothetical protein
LSKELSFEQIKEGQQYLFTDGIYRKLVVTVTKDLSKDGLVAYKLRVDKSIGGMVKVEEGTEFVVHHNPATFTLKKWQLCEIDTIPIDDEE